MQKLQSFFVSSANTQIVIVLVRKIRIYLFERIKLASIFITRKLVEFFKYMKEPKQKDLEKRTYMNMGKFDI